MYYSVCFVVQKQKFILVLLSLHENIIPNSPYNCITAPSRREGVWQGHKATNSQIETLSEILHFTVPE
jgi:hypothetical protein